MCTLRQYYGRPVRKRIAVARYAHELVGIIFILDNVLIRRGYSRDKRCYPYQIYSEDKAAQVLLLESVEYSGFLTNIRHTEGQTTRSVASSPDNREVGQLPQ